MSTMNPNVLLDSLDTSRAVGRRIDYVFVVAGPD
jgi:hypothetical protein